MAQTSTTTPTPPAQASTAQAGSGQLLTQMSPDMMRGSKLMGVDVYGSDNQKIGDIDEVLVDKQGKIQAVVVGVGGFLGVGQKDIALRYDQVQWMSNQDRRREHRATLLEQEGEVCGRRRGEREAQAEEHGQRPAMW